MQQAMNQAMKNLGFVRRHGDVIVVQLLSRVRLFGTPWTAAHQAPLPMGFSRQEYWSGLPLSDIVLLKNETGLELDPE